MSNLDLSHINDQKSLALTGSILLIFLEHSKLNDENRLFAGFRGPSKQTKGILEDLEVTQNRIEYLKEKTK